MRQRTGARFRHILTSLAPVRRATDIGGSLGGREWSAMVAVVCLAFSTAMTALLYVGVATLEEAIRLELGGTGDDIVHIEAAKGVMDVQAGTALTQLDHALASIRRSPVTRHMTVLRATPRDRRVELVGVAPALLALQGMELREGRWFSPHDAGGAQRVAVLGRTLVDSVYRGVPPRRVRLARVTLEVIGVAESGALAPVDVDRSIMVPVSMVQRLSEGTAGASSMLVSVSHDERSASLHDTWRLLERRDVRFAGRLTMVSSSERLGEVSELAEALHRGATALSVVLAIASLAAVAALMLTIARGHARVVGITRAMGASRWQVVAQGFVIGTAVGVIGVGVGLLCVAGAAELVPRMFELPVLSAGTLLWALTKAGALPLVMATCTSVVCFARLSLRTPASLLG